MKKNRTKLVAVLTFSMGGAAAVYAQKKTFTGTLTDSMFEFS